MMGAARKIAHRLSLSGFFGLDFVIKEGTGAAYLIEMNPRCTPPCHLRLGIGREMIGALSEQLTGKPLSEPVSVTQNNLIAYFPQALLRNSEFLASSYHDVPEGESELIRELLRVEQLHLRNEAATTSFTSRDTEGCCHVLPAPGSARRRRPK
jgi:predicted ATP-grasp superfamily ATP-dependent carboligase